MVDCRRGWEFYFFAGQGRLVSGSLITDFAPCRGPENKFNRAWRFFQFLCILFFPYMPRNGLFAAWNRQCAVPPNYSINGARDVKQLQHRLLNGLLPLPIPLVAASAVFASEADLAIPDLNKNGSFTIAGNTITAGNL